MVVYCGFQAGVGLVLQVGLETSKPDSQTRAGRVLPTGALRVDKQSCSPTSPEGVQDVKQTEPEQSAQLLEKRIMRLCTRASVGSP